jgi:hypothetical protein
VAAFTRPSDALGAALDAQLSLTTEETGLTVRMAIHTSEAELRDASNYFGPAAPRSTAARRRAPGSTTRAGAATTRS